MRNKCFETLPIFEFNLGLLNTNEKHCGWNWHFGLNVSFRFHFHRNWIEGGLKKRLKSRCPLLSLRLGPLNAGRGNF